MRLSHWMALVFALFGALTSGGLVARHMNVSRREAYAQTQRLGAVTLEAVRALVQAQARQGRFLEMGQNFGALVRQADIATIVVRDRKGRRLVGRSDAPRLREIAAEGVQAGVTAFLALAMGAWILGMFAGERIGRVVSRIESLAADPERFRPLRAGLGLGGDEVSRLAEAFNRMGASLKAETFRRRELEAEKRELSAMLVHDLKTPLTVIRSGITLLADLAEGPDGKREHARTFELLEMSTVRLQRMVEDVLQLAKLEETPSLQNIHMVDLLALSKDCAKDFELVVKDRKQSLELCLPEKPLPRVPGDPALLRRVLDNLVHNAVEHTPSRGRITIGVRAQGAGVTVEVCDSGPGVPLEARADIFLKFFQKDVKRHVGNVGLGLALCEKVVARHGGTIGIGDAKPKGARFYFTLPVSTGPSEPEEA